MRGRILEIIAILSMLIILGFLSYQLVKQPSHDSTPTVAVIVKGSQNDRWKVLKEGMKQASEIYDIDLRFATVPEYVSNNDLWSRALEEKNNGADAIIICPFTSPESTQEKGNGLKDIPVIVLGSDIATDGVYRNVYADDYQIGYTMGEALWNDYGAALLSKKIGVVSGEIVQASVQKRKDGLMDSLASHGGGVAWSIGLGKSLKSTLDRQLQNASTKTDILVALGNLETEIAIESVLEEELKVPIYGVGYSEKTVYYLDKGTVECLVLTNEFSLGYRCVEIAAEELILAKRNIMDETFSIYCVHGEDMYESEYQKIMFPLVQ